MAKTLFILLRFKVYFNFSALRFNSLPLMNLLTETPLLIYLLFKRNKEIF